MPLPAETFTSLASATGRLPHNCIAKWDSRPKSTGAPTGRLRLLLGYTGHGHATRVETLTTSGRNDQRVI